MAPNRRSVPALTWSRTGAKRTQMLLFGEAHLRRILSAYATYYNQARTHMALQKDAPRHRAVQRNGTIVAIPVLAGLHHRYARI